MGLRADVREHLLDGRGAGDGRGPHGLARAGRRALRVDLVQRHDPLALEPTRPVSAGALPHRTARACGRADLDRCGETP